MVSTSVVVKIHRSAIYQPVSPCAFLRNTSLSSDASIKSCIWECVHVDNCQAAVYYSNEKNCSMFAESCTSQNIHSSNNIQASVICYPRGNDNVVTCPSTMAPHQVEETTAIHRPCNVTLANQTTYSTGSSPRGVSVADFNNDNKTDIVVANYPSSQNQ